MCHIPQVSLLPALMLATLWCVSICVSRVYLGVHSLWDIFTGVTISVSILLLVEPVLNLCDPLLFAQPWYLSVLPLIGVLLVKMYPRVEWWSMDVGDTTAIVASGLSMVMGSFLNSLNHTYFARHMVAGESLGYAIGSITVEKIGKIHLYRLDCCLFVYFRTVGSESCIGCPDLDSD